MARKTIRIDIPEGKPDELLELINAVAAKYNEDAKNSPLKGLKMDDFLAKQVKANEKRREAKRLADLSQTTLAEAESLIGMAPGQTRQTEGTLLYYLTLIRDQLLVIHKGNEDKLRDFGFKVSVSTASTPQRKPKG